MRTVAFIQAHMGSSRLPGKVLLDLAGSSVLSRVVARVRRFRRIDEAWVVTSILPVDDVIEKACAGWKIPVFRGSDADVLDRFYRAARSARADACVRITSDCPLIDPGVSDRVIRAFQEASPPVDYASNKIPQSFPRGLDTEVFTATALERAWREAKEPYQRAHVTIYLYENPGAFRLLPVTSDVDRAGWRWTVDTAEDLAFVREIYARFAPRDDFSWEEVLELLRREPALTEINRHVIQKDPRDG